MAKSPLTVEALSNDYLQASLLDTEDTRKSQEVLLSRLSDALGSRLKSYLSRLQENIEATRHFGEIARKMARQGMAGDSLELETLLIKASLKGKPAARQFVLKQYQEEMEHLAPESALELSRTIQMLPPEDRLNVWDISTPMEEEEEEEKTAGKTAPSSITPSAEEITTVPPPVATEDTPEKNIPAQPQGIATPFKLPEAWKKPQPPPGTNKLIAKTYGEHWYQYCYFGLNPWGDGSPNMQKDSLDSAHSSSNSEVQFKKDKEHADTWLSGARKAMDHALSCGNSEPWHLPEVQAYGAPLPQVISHIQNCKKRDTARKNNLPIALSSHQSKILPLTSTFAKADSSAIPDFKHPQPPPVTGNALHPNCIHTLLPAHKWELYIDESGSDFSTNASGLIGGILTTPENPLPTAEMHHACDEADERALTIGDKLLNTLLHHPQCGVLAVPINAYQASINWATAIASYIDLVLRLLPMPKDQAPVDLTVFVEQRSIYDKDSSFSSLRDVCYCSLLNSFPERASRIVLDIQVMDKSNSYNAYADIVAHTCLTRTNQDRRYRFQTSQWDGSCFLNIPPDKMRSLWDFMHLRHTCAAPQDWNLLLENHASSSSPTLISAILDIFGDEACHTPEVWRQYLGYTVAHLDSKAINLNRLAAQLNWLKRHQPCDAELPPRVRLLWMTAKLAQANHLGEVNSLYDIIQEFTRLRRELFEEDAPLTCAATLHLAVEMTNEFRFEDAKRLLLDYARSAHVEWPQNMDYTIDDVLADKQLAAMVGLRYYGQLLSSLGQHEAFLGHSKEAVRLLSEAIRCFERLSENQEGDIQQTSAYLATAQMDADIASPVSREILERYLGMSLIDAAKAYAVSSDDGEKYQHHILLRYLAQSEDKAAIDAYLSVKKRWAEGTGHPWEMIEFYRALLLKASEERLDYMRRADSLLQKMPGATLQLIRCVVLGALHALTPEAPVSGDYIPLVQQVYKEIPALDEGIIRTLRRQADVPMEPLELARAILPFNFR